MDAKGILRGKLHATTIAKRIMLPRRLRDDLAGNNRKRANTIRSLAAVLRYLRASLKWYYSRYTACLLTTTRNIVASTNGESGELFVEDQDDGYEVWEVIRSLIHDERQKHVAYLIYHCGLKPREIVKLRLKNFLMFRKSIACGVVLSSDCNGMQIISVGGSIINSSNIITIKEDLALL